MMKGKKEGRNVYGHGGGGAIRGQGTLEGKKPLGLGPLNIQGSLVKILNGRQQNWSKASGGGECGETREQKISLC